MSFEPIGWVYQHEDTGRTTFCENDGINTTEVFQRLNPRHVLCGPAYSEPGGWVEPLARELTAALDEAQRVNSHLRGWMPNESALRTWLMEFAAKRNEAAYEVTPEGRAIAAAYKKRQEGK